MGPEFVYSVLTMVAQSGVPEVAWKALARPLRRADGQLVETSSTDPVTTSLGVEVGDVFTLRTAPLGDGFQHFELIDSAGEVVLSGIGDSIVDALMAMGFRLEDGPDPDVPNN
jgi:hypothetical protein